METLLTPGLSALINYAVYFVNYTPVLIELCSSLGKLNYSF